MPARRPVCLLRVFRINKRGADSGDVVIREQGFSIFGTHEPEIVIPHISVLSLYGECVGTRE
jgi:hypothetical protein